MRIKIFDLMKGAAILAVVFIHSLGYLSVSNKGTFEWYISIISRQFVNFAVPIFLFISGFLSFSRDIHDTLYYLKRKLLRIIIPYLSWSCFYFFFLFTFNNQSFVVKNIIAQLILGTGIGVGYFVIVLVQFIILTPLINKITSIKTHIMIICGFTIIGGVVNYMSVKIDCLKLFSQFPYSAIPFFVWYPFYHLGFVFNKYNISCPKCLNSSILFGILSFSLTLAIFEGMFWGYAGNYSFAVSQLKLSSLILSLCVCMIAYFYLNRDINYKSLSQLGTISYGIYLTHMLFVWLYHYLFSHTSMYIRHLVISCGFIFILSIISSVVLVFLIRKILGRYSVYIVG
ncbi:acyltransferase [Escherichia albertii]|uniref:Predicted acyltransferase n=1 Tax=Escherichia albertii TaxID=208962 RepID=A0A5A4U6J7_ESCAL|nr:acyltransferase [Escherichia albertii]MCB2256805.1 acyltransferase [Escherichia albertii]MCB2264569.1 acyltransferase [Escherichia albertii]MCB2270543.1 acyltransferase [Escherichia albertii]BBM62756.1 predicted acyltransferase [Escherichia albertii]